MKPLQTSLIAIGVVLALGDPSHGANVKCAANAVKVGSICVDKYEASVWQISPTNTALIKQVQKGKATLSQLTGGATQIGVAGTASCTPGYPASFPPDGNWTPLPASDPPSPGVYAVAVPGVMPSACITWFQAEQACRLSGKRLLTNQEWQAAAAGTPQTPLTPGPTDCNTNSSGPALTGSRAACKSSWGVFDMAGNVDEWVADWVPRSTDCPGWGAFSGNYMCLSGAFTTATGPGAFIRGGDWTLGDGTLSGPFAIFGNNYPNTSDFGIGFRCAH